MAGEEILDYLIADFQERPLPEFTPRQVRLPVLPQKADALIGMRRSGKTYTLYQEMSRLLDAGVPKSRMLFLNLEDDRLQPLTSGSLSDALEAFYRRYPASRTELAYLFLDEVQNVPDWQRFVRRVLDTEKVQVYVTGSSAKLLSLEIATALRGRSVSVEILPFSFHETLIHAGRDIPETFPPGAQARSRLARSLDEYLEQGGFPEVQGIDPRDRLRILQEYLDVVILRDVVERHGVKNVETLRYLVRSLLGSVAQPFSVNKVLKDLKSQGTPVAKDTLHAHLGYLQDAFLFFLVPIHRGSARARQVNPRKAYAIDPGLASSQTWLGASARGRMLENLVYLQLRRRALESGNAENIAYYLTGDRREVDFTVGVGPPGTVDGGMSLIQVCADLSDPATRSGEIGPLRTAMSETQLRDGTVVTLYQEETLSVPEGTIRVVPAWRWALERT
jgi:predicted AAA+ superfamily ATPase